IKHPIVSQTTYTALKEQKKPTPAQPPRRPLAHQYKNSTKPTTITQQPTRTFPITPQPQPQTKPNQAPTTKTKNGKTPPTLPGNHPAAPPPARAVRVAHRHRGGPQRPDLHPELEHVQGRADATVPAAARERPAPQAAHRRGARRAPRQDLQGAAALGRGAVRAVVSARGAECGPGACAHHAAGRGALGAGRRGRRGRRCGGGDGG
ncbi:uncharacterized protein BO72DRAFT_511105, partial [Aspergillus fijiensis CBS 313.89]